MISCRIFKTGLLGSCLLASAGAIAEDKDIHPNVILILTDDQGYGDMACHGNPWIKTPAMDKLHSESIRFTNFHVSPTCAPTRGALMTGRYPNAIGTWHTINGRNMMWEDEKTLVQVFAKNGYKTGIFGKWHLGDNSPHRPQDRGFQESVIHRGGGITQAPDHWDNDYFDDTYLRNGEPEDFQGYCTDIWFSEAEKFIARNKNTPFFAFISTNAPHAPFNVPEKYAAMYKDKPIPNAKFYGMITNIDENIANLREFLEKNKLKEKTILIFMSDNGTAKGFNDSSVQKKGFNAGMRGKKGSPYEGGHRVPFFIYWPDGKLQGGKDIDELTAHIDLFPTLVELCHLYSESKKQIHGKSLVPLLYGQGSSWPDRVLVIDSQRVNIPQEWQNSSTMTQQWRLINGQELYDIQNDTEQQNNLAEKMPEIVKELRQQYEKWWKFVSKEFNGRSVSIDIGADSENPVILSSHDWYMNNNDNSVWSQNEVRKGLAKNGYWLIDVKKAGEYEIALRRWPKSLNAGINDPIPDGKALKINKAKILIGGTGKTNEIKKKDKEAVFNISLQPGRYRFQTWFYSDDAPEGETIERGAYFVYITKK